MAETFPLPTAASSIPLPSCVCSKPELSQGPEPLQDTVSAALFPWEHSWGLCKIPWQLGGYHRVKAGPLGQQLWVQILLCPGSTPQVQLAGIQQPREMPTHPQVEIRSHKPEIQPGCLPLLQPGSSGDFRGRKASPSQPCGCCASLQSKHWCNGTAGPPADV